MQLLPLVFADMGGRRRLRALYPLIGTDSPTIWMNVAMEGAWSGHGSGEFAFSPEVFRQIVANFERNPNPIPLDYEHATEVAIPAPAAGWIHKVEVRAGANGRSELWALAELTDQAAEYIKTGAYRFTSGVFDFDSVDPESGDSIGVEMPSVALTNVPFLRGQTPLALSQRFAASNGAQPMYQVDKAELISRLRKLEGDSVTPEQAQKLAAALGMLAEAQMPPAEPEKPEEAKPEGEEKPEDEDKPMAAAPSAPAAALNATQAAPAAPVPASEPVAAEMAPPAAEEPPADAGADVGGLAAQLMELTGMDMAALAEALKQMVAGGLPAAAAPLSARLRESELALSARDHTIRALSQRAESAEAEVKVYREREADAAVSVLIDTGRLLDSAREDMRSLYLSNRKSFDALSAALPEVVPVGEHAAGQTPPTQLTPAIDEDDPQVKSLRRQFAQTRLSKAAQDKAIADAIAKRKTSQTRV